MYFELNRKMHFFCYHKERSFRCQLEGQNYIIFIRNSRAKSLKLNEGILDPIGYPKGIHLTLTMTIFYIIFDSDQVILILISGKDVSTV